jgi:hypothetical protein
MLQTSQPRGLKGANKQSSNQQGQTETVYIDAWLSKESNRVPVTESAYVRLENHEDIFTVYNITPNSIHYVIERKTLNDDNASLQKKLLKKKQSTPSKGQSTPGRGTTVAEFEYDVSVQVWNSDRNEDHYTPYTTGASDGLGVYIITDFNNSIKIRKVSGPPPDAPNTILIKNRCKQYEGPLFVTVVCGTHIIEKDIDMTKNRDMVIAVPDEYSFTLVECSGPNQYTYIGDEGILFDPRTQQIVVGYNEADQLVPFAIEKQLSKYEPTP